MIRILTLLFVLIISSSSFGQVAYETKKYFSDYILQLDPLEGVYSARFFSQDRGRGRSKQWSETNEVAILKKPNGDLQIVGNNQVTFKRIGETNAYDVYVKFPAATATSRAYLTNGIGFNYESKIPEAQLRYDGENVYSVIYTGGELIKKYPTASMYAEALRKTQELAKPTNWTGTGFALKDNCVVTNYHVVEGAKSISIRGINGSFTKSYSADVIATDKYNDLAILKVNGVTIPSANIPYSIKTNTAEVGEEIFVLGYPLTATMGDEIKLTTGVVSSRSGFQGDVSLYQISAPIQPGNSGGPLFDSKGNIIGIVSAKHTGAENVGYAIKASYLRNLVESSINHDILPKTNKIMAMNLANKVKVVKNFVYYITCSSTGSGTVYNRSSSNINTPSSSSTNNYPSINDTGGTLSVTSVVANAYETILSFSATNNNLSGGWAWINISKDAYIMANGIKYKLTGVEGIAYAPDVTHFSYRGQTNNFKIHFQAIPPGTKTIDFIEGPSSSWKIYGIKIK